jgi:hypothetical protein
MKLFTCGVCDGGHLLLLLLLALLLDLIYLKEIMIPKVRVIAVGLQGLEIVAVFQEPEVFGLLEWVEGEAKTHHWIVHSFYQMTTNYWIRLIWLVRLVVVRRFFRYQMATTTSLPVCF